MEEKQITNEFEDFIPKVHFELIPIKNLVSNQDYQRNLSIHMIQGVNRFPMSMVACLQKMLKFQISLNRLWTF